MRDKYFCLGYYLYAEASYPRRQGDKARLGSSVFSPTQRSCFVRFYYHMTGNHIGSLRVKTRQCTTCDEVVVWERSISSGDFWIKQGVELKSSRPFQVSSM